MIVAFLTFHPDQYNMARRDHGGIWRVRECTRLFDGAPPPRVEVVKAWYPPRPNTDPVEMQTLRMPVARPYPRGCIVKPKRLIEDFLRGKDHDRH